MDQQHSASPRLTETLRRASWPVWLLLAVPAIPMAAQVLSGEGTRGLIRETGEWSARIAIISLMLTPLMIAFPKQQIIRWLMHNRRHIGLAAFLYALAHVVLIAMRGRGLELLSGADLRPLVVHGWIAFALFIVLAATSNDWSVQHMGVWWKRVQRMTYVAAIAIAFHWYLVERNFGVIFFHFGPLVLLEAYRVGWHLKLRARRAKTGQP